MNSLLCDLIVWSEFVKVTKFAVQIGVSKQAISSYIKYGTKSMSDDKIKELHTTIKQTMKEHFA